MENKILYVTMQANYDFHEGCAGAPIAVYMTKEAADAAIARGVEASKELEKLRTSLASKYNIEKYWFGVNSSSQRTDKYHIKAEDGEWYMNDKDAAFATEKHALEESQRVKELMAWAREEYVETADNRI